MNTTRFAPLSAVVVLLALLPCRALAQETPKPDAAPPAESWPRTFEEDGLRFKISQPEVERWANLRLTGRAYVSVETAGTATFSFSSPGTLWIEARTGIDREHCGSMANRAARRRIGLPGY